MEGPQALCLIYGNDELKMMDEDFDPELGKGGHSSMPELVAYDPELEKGAEGDPSSVVELESSDPEEGKNLLAIVPASSNACPPCSQKENLNTANDETNSSTERKRVRKTLDLFHSLCKELLREGKIRRIDYGAARAIRNLPDFVNIEKCIGPIPGVEVGAEFTYRMELALVGLHKPPEAGIDFMRWGPCDLGISIVAIGRGDYANFMRNAESLTYCGQGGNVGRGRKEPQDQMMERGNLALKNSIASRNPVRVIRGRRETSKVIPVYIYDGLYTVETYQQEKAPHGKLVFLFELRKIPGQPKLSIDQLRKLGIVEGS